MFIAAGDCKIQVNAISHLIKEAPDKVTIHFMGDKTLMLEGPPAREFIRTYELFVEGRISDEEHEKKQKELLRRK